MAVEMDAGVLVGEEGPDRQNQAQDHDQDAQDIGRAALVQAHGAGRQGAGGVLVGLGGDRGQTLDGHYDLIGRRAADEGQAVAAEDQPLRLRHLQARPAGEPAIGLEVQSRQGLDHHLRRTGLGQAGMAQADRQVGQLQLAVRAAADGEFCRRDRA